MSRQLDVHKTYHITVRGTGAGAISTPTGVLLDGNKDNTPGGDYNATINFQTLASPTLPASFKTKVKAVHKAKPVHVAAKVHARWAGHLATRMGGR